jgi:diguanylate cyclase (GGDEF)-like protein/putative nucleotidyltransferase with HDIG domain
VSDNSLLRAAHRLSEALLSARSSEAVGTALMEELQATLGVDQVHLTEVSQDGDVGEGTVGGSPAPGYRQWLGGPSLISRVIAAGASVAVPDAPGDPTLSQDLVARFSAASLLGVPVRWGGEARFVAVVITHERRAFETDEIELAETLANQASIALALLEAERSRAATAEQDAALTRAAIALNASLELVEVLETLSREADLAVGGSLAGVYLADGSGGGVATAGHNTPEDWKGIVMERGEGIAGRVLETGRAFVTNAYQEEVDLPPHPALRRLKTAVGLPMAWNGELKGALSVGFAEMRRVTDDDLRTLEAIAALAVAACRNAEAYEQASLAAITDALTGLLNHGALHLRAREEISRSRRTGAALTCLLLDLDNFKAINDERGHQAGDDVLRAVATAMRGRLRDHDVVARYGGDEFVVLLPDTDAAGARNVAERIAAGSPAPCSIGLAQWEEPLGADELLGRADRALLLAKRRGKQRVTVVGADLEDELDLTDARIGSPAATLRDFWEMVAGSESAREALETLPSFLRRVTSAEEVALYELEGTEVVRTVDARRERDASGASGRGREDPQVQAFTCERLAAGPALMERLALGAFSRPSLAVLLATLDVASTPGDLDAPAGSYAAVPLVHSGRARGLLVLRLERELQPERLRQIEGLARQTMAMFGARPDTGSPAAVQALAAAIDARDNHTHQHSEQVVALATDVARLLGLSPPDLEQVRHGALLHDVGKLAIPNEILHKPGPLTDAEWRVMAEHPVIGERILRRTPQLGHLAPIVRHEHERWDGGGYPDGLARTAIPIASRIILACDAYNAMITTRPYREAMSIERATAELREKSGTQFDPQVVEALLERLGAVSEAASGASAK